MTPQHEEKIKEVKSEIESIEATIKNNLHEDTLAVSELLQRKAQLLEKLERLEKAYRIA